MTRQIFVRFVTDKMDKVAGQRLGVFQAIFDLIDADEFESFELSEANALCDWFHRHLAAPDRFSRSQRSGAASRAICWFKSSATEHVSRMHNLCRLLREHGISTEMICSERPGYVVFEDEHQLAAEPFFDTKT